MSRADLVMLSIRLGAASSARATAVVASNMTSIESVLIRSPLWQDSNYKEVRAKADHGDLSRARRCAGSAMRSSAPGLHASGLLVLPCRVHQAENRTTASTATLRMAVAIPATSMLTRLDAMRHFWRQSSDGVDLRRARWGEDAVFTGAVEPPGCCSILLPWFRSVDAPPASSNRACRRRWPGRRPARSGFTKSSMTAIG